MSSLKFIMDVDVDHEDPHRDKKAAGSFATTSGTRVPDPSAYQRQASPSGQGTLGTTSSPLIPVTRSILSAATTATTRSYTTPTAISAIIEGPPPSLPPPPPPPSRTQLVTITLPSRQSSAETGTHQTGSTDSQPGPTEANSLSARPAALRRHSTTSASTMDQHGYSPLSPMRMGPRGGPGRAASLGGFVDSSGQASSVPNRPLQPQTHLESPIRLTPITGRISRARKGQPVHVCDICRPAKTFTRAEHLRRHQLGHGTPQFPCLVPGCDRAFHRADLLARHQQKHQEGDSAPAPSRPSRDQSPSGGPGRRAMTYPANTSNVTLRQGPSSGASQTTPGSGSGPGAPTGAAPNDTPSTPNINHNRLHHTFDSSPAGNPSSQVSPLDVSKRFSIDAGPRRISQDFNSAYTLSPSAQDNPTIRYCPVPTTYEAVPTQISFNPVNYQAPREVRQLCVVTEGLSGSSLHVPDAGIPDLSLSPMYQSSTDGSTYSTPSDPRAMNAPWAVPRQSSPQMYPALSVETTSSGPWTTPFVYSQGQNSPSSIVSPPMFSAYSEFGHPYNGGFLDESIGPYPAMDQADHFQLAIDENSTPASSFSRGNENQGDSLPSGVEMRNRSLLGGLVAPVPVLPADHVGMNSSLARQKPMMTVAPSPSIITSSGGGFSSSHGASFGFGSGDDSGAGPHGFANSRIRSGCASAPISLTSSLPRHIHNVMPTYEDVYWDSLDPEYPFVHRRMSDEADDDVLRSAMAAVGAQCLDGLEHRVRSSILHKHAWEEVRRIPKWNLQTMQAILLCEYLARFRGNRLVHQPSKPFENLYSRAINQVHSLFDAALTAQSNPHLSAQNRWRNWLAKESYRRLASSCFVLDVHASLYHQTSRTRDFNMLEPGTAPPLTFTGPSQALWDASSAEEWDAILNANPAAGTPIPMPPSETVAATLPEDGSSMSARSGPQRSFDQFLILATETLRLPKRVLGSGIPNRTPLATSSGQFTTQLVSCSAAFKVEDRIAKLFRYSPIANTYLALHHTPLHELLAVTGSPGNFHHKNLPYQQGRVRQWTASLEVLDSNLPKTAEHFDKSASRAVVYATRALAEFLSTPYTGRATIGAFTDYWGIFVCTLICWACGNRVAAAANGSVSDNTIASSEQEAREWLHLTASLQPTDDAAINTVAQDGRWAGVIGLARRQIEQDCSANSSGNIIADVLAVLTRLDADRRKMF
ncbi:hypothetical protein MCOR27_004141 [Pyricularia oryzae]|nr:hypothetical protein MCOR01_007034 [Pyricularia oryzae]KAI6258717.1 hypothetical protein MCOR19_004893 [Pyricularia oryzae]KAI6277692.1 hypothetical protein MCOR26_004981 [Pyricularia oryzae]KAI6281610.1 hypothetical protein MCOR27_004141 [Pyricularia oryzae]KAI6333284.1 hypothetical protein MCOR30_004313 [Pyricularia oryzae]